MKHWERFKKGRFTSRLRICLSRSANWFLRAWISAVAGFSFGSSARITYEQEKKGIQVRSNWTQLCIFEKPKEKKRNILITHIASFLQVHFVPLFHGPHVIILLLQSGHQLIQFQGLEAHGRNYEVILRRCILCTRLHFPLLRLQWLCTTDKTRLL